MKLRVIVNKREAVRGKSRKLGRNFFLDVIGLFEGVRLGINR